MQTLPERIRAIMEKHQCSRSDIARAAGVKPPSVSNWLDGKTKTLKAVPALRLSGNFKLNMQWLTTGIGMMDATDESHAALEHAAQSGEELRLLEAFRNIPFFLRPLVLTVLDSFASLGGSFKAGDRFGQTASAAIGKSMSHLVEILISLRK